MTETAGTLDLVMARELLAAVFDRLGLDAYLFEVELVDGAWVAKVECATSAGWERVEVVFSHDQLRRASGESGVLEQLREAIEVRLADCKRRS